MTTKKKPETRTRELSIGDVVAIMWYDTHNETRVPFEELKNLEDPEPTQCWGAVIKITDRYLWIASELGDRKADGNFPEAIPHTAIDSIVILDHIELEM